MKLTPVVIVLIFSMLITGSINTLAKRAQNQSWSTDSTGNYAKFQKPWSQTLIMFTAELMSLVYFNYTMRQQRRQEREKARAAAADEETPLVAPGQTEAAAQPYLLVAIPALCDLFGTTMSGIGLLYVDSSVWQMLRGSIIIFSGVLTVLFLKRKLFPYHWFAIGVVTSGLCFVGTASWLSSSHTNMSSEDSSKVLMGFFCIVLGQLAGAMQMVVEEMFLKDHNMEAAQVVGLEGLWGCLLMSIVVLPLLWYLPGHDHGSYESAIDAFTMIDAMRTVVVWITSLFIFYFVDPSFGEAWSPYSWIQLLGFGLLITGTLVYKELIELPCFEYARYSKI